MKKKIKERIVDYVKTNYTLLDINKFINGKTYFNRKCHLNSVQEAIDNNYDVLLVICVDNDDVFVHFINIDSKGRYIDSTLGWYGKELYDYYLIRKIDKREYKTIWQNLINTKKMLINLNSNWLERKLGFIKEDDV